MTNHQGLLPNLPGKITPVGWRLPNALDEIDWIKCGQALVQCQAAVQWWLGDWWAFGVRHGYGEGSDLAERVGINHQTIMNYASVCRTFQQFSRRRDNLEFGHHEAVCREGLTASQQDRWLDRAERDELSVSRLRAAIMQAAALARTQAVEFNARALGKYALIYADPPWRYESPPLGSITRAVENHHPTMTFEDICALPVADIAHDDAIMFLWTTAPLLMRTRDVVTSWGFEYKTSAVWVKDQIGMGFYFRLRHEYLLVCKRGNMPCPPEEARQDSIIESPRRQYSAKPPVVYDIIELMYPDVRKIELFARSTRRGWKSWGNQVEAVTIPDQDYIIEEAAE